MQTDTLAAPCGALSKNQPASTSVFFPARLTDNRESKYFLWINKAEHLQPRRLDTTAFHNGSRENERWKLIAREQKSYYFSPPVRFQLLDSCLPKLHTHTHTVTHTYTLAHTASHRLRLPPAKFHTDFPPDAQSKVEFIIVWGGMSKVLNKCVMQTEL